MISILLELWSIWESNPLQINTALCAIAIVIVGKLILARKTKSRLGPKVNQPTKAINGHEMLVCHSAEFSKKEIIRVTDGVWVGIGYGLANSIMIEANDGVIVVDCLESEENATDLMTNFRKLCNKPIVALIYTHNHADHVTGARTFMNFAVNKVCDVYGHEKLEKILKTFMAKTGSVGFKRSGRQFGQFLPPNQHLNCGIGPCLGYTQETMLDIILPNITFSKQLNVTISGVELQLHHAPGETDDQIVVFLPQKSVLCAADNIYKAFPNLYAIRGTPTRDAHQWANSIELMRSFGANYLVPSHTRPLTTHESVNDTLLVYRDAILFVHDQTVRYMNAGMFIDDIVPRIQLPPHLIDHPYLQEYYGTVAWGVRGVFNSCIGWFGGDPAHIHPLSPPEQAKRMVALAGGLVNLLSTATQALNTGDAQWALLCAQSIMRAIIAANEERHTSNTSASVSDPKVSPEYTSALNVAVSALEMLAEGQVSANGRNYYLTYALELAGSLSLNPSFIQIKGVTRTIGAVEIVKMLPARLNPQTCLDVQKKVIYQFPDLSTSLLLELNRGVARVVDITETVSSTSTSTSESLLERYNADLFVVVDSTVFVDIASKERSSVAAVLGGDMRVTGKGVVSSMALKEFMEYFDDSSVEIPVPI